MADDIKTQMAAVRERLTALLRKVPDKVNNGGHGTAVAFKNDAIKAQKALAGARSSLLVLTQAYNAILFYHQN